MTAALFRVLIAWASIAGSCRARIEGFDAPAA
jgi:hypothetical protein